MYVGRLLELSETSSKSVSSAEKTTTTYSENGELTTKLNFLISILLKSLTQQLDST